MRGRALLKQRCEARVEHKPPNFSNVIVCSMISSCVKIDAKKKGGMGGSGRFFMFFIKLNTKT